LIDLLNLSFKAPSSDIYALIYVIRVASDMRVIGIHRNANWHRLCTWLPQKVARVAKRPRSRIHMAAAFQLGRRIGFPLCLRCNRFQLTSSVSQLVNLYLNTARW